MKSSLISTFRNSWSYDFNSSLNMDKRLLFLIILYFNLLSMSHKRMFKKDCEEDINRLAGQIYKSPARCRILIEDNVKWY